MDINNCSDNDSHTDSDTNDDGQWWMIDKNDR